MKKKHIPLLLLLLHVITANIHGQDFNKISNQIYKYEEQMLYTPEDYITGSYRELYDSLRKNLNILEKVSICNKRDTVYLLEYYGDGSDYVLEITAWNNCDTLSYTYDHFDRRVSSTHKYAVFSKYMYDLVSKWDCSELKKNGNSASLSPCTRIFAARIIFNGKKYTIDCVSFNFFWDYNRDGYDLLLN